ncbi:hypothetical protein SGX77_20130, partial [Klebsiella pneumoniae]|uniref:hypothetical protein n=2 Tax=Klebsiella pneumoniae TaxID=573 RepID=UPI001AAE71C3
FQKVTIARSSFTTRMKGCNRGADFGANRRLEHDLGQPNVRICPHLSCHKFLYLIEMWLYH